MLNTVGNSKMISTLEITLYPNEQDYLTPIRSFIDRLNQYKDQFEIQTFPTATIVVGDHDLLMSVISEATKAHREAFGMGPFVMKLIPGYEAFSE